MQVEYTHIRTFTFTFSYLADAFIQSDLQMRTLEAIKTNKRAYILYIYNYICVCVYLCILLAINICKKKQKTLFSTNLKQIAKMVYCIDINIIKNILKIL